MRGCLACNSSNLFCMHLFSCPVVENGKLFWLNWASICRNRFGCAVIYFRTVLKLALTELKVKQRLLLDYIPPVNSSRLNQLLGFLKSYSYLCWYRNDYD